MLLLAGTLVAGEVLDYLEIDGQRYESVKWGPVNQGKVVIYHSRGVAFIPLEKLPSEYQARFGYRPTESVQPQPPAESDPRKILESMRAKRLEPAAPAENTGEWAEYNRDRKTKVMLDGKLVEKSSLKEVTGFLVKEKAQVTSTKRSVQGAALELAQRRSDEKVNAAMELRPSLWKGTDEHVLLADYVPTAFVGALLRVYVAEDSPVEGRRIFRVGTEPTFEQWQASKRKP